MVAALVAVLTGVGVYWAAEQRGRSGAVWLIVAMVVVSLSYAVADFAAHRFVGTDAIYDPASGAAALGVVAAGPLAGIAAALVLAWRILVSPPTLRRGQVVSMHGGYDGHDDRGAWDVRVHDEQLVLARAGAEERRIGLGEIERAEVDGECLALRVRGDEDTLLLRPYGPKYPDRDLRVAAVRGLIAALRRQS